MVDKLEIPSGPVEDDPEEVSADELTPATPDGADAEALTAEDEAAAAELMAQPIPGITDGEDEPDTPSPEPAEVPDGEAEPGEIEGVETPAAPEAEGTDEITEDDWRRLDALELAEAANGDVWSDLPKSVTGEPGDDDALDMLRSELSGLAGQVSQTAQELVDLREEWDHRLIPDDFEVRWGKATAAWTSGNSVTLDPCDVSGTDNGLPNVTGYVFTPTGYSALDARTVMPAIAQNDVLAYIPYPGNKGVVVNPPVKDRFFPVNVSRDGGSGGNATTQCSFTYTVADLAGSQLASAKSPTFTNRTSAGEFAEATHGTAYYQDDGTLVLWQVDEVPAVEVCT